jgi:hypothetical protein
MRIVGVGVIRDERHLEVIHILKNIEHGINGTVRSSPQVVAGETLGKVKEADFLTVDGCEINQQGANPSGV